MKARGQKWKWGIIGGMIYVFVGVSALALTIIFSDSTDIFGYIFAFSSPVIWIYGLFLSYDSAIGLFDPIFLLIFITSDFLIGFLLGNTVRALFQRS